MRRDHKKWEMNGVSSIGERESSVIKNQNSTEFGYLT